MKSLLPAFRIVHNALMMRVAADSKLPPTTAFALISIYHYPECESPVALSDALKCPRPTTTAIIDALEKKGYIRRILHPTDRRRLIIKLTARGKSEAERILENLLEAEKTTLQVFTREECATFHALANKLADSLKDWQPK